MNRTARALVLLGVVLTSACLGGCGAPSMDALSSVEAACANFGSTWQVHGVDVHAQSGDDVAVGIVSPSRVEFCSGNSFATVGIFAREGDRGARGLRVLATTEPQSSGLMWTLVAIGGRQHDALAVVPRTGSVLRRQGHYAIVGFRSRYDPSDSGARPAFGSELLETSSEGLIERTVLIRVCPDVMTVRLNHCA